MHLYAGIVQIPGTTQLTTRDIKQRLQRSCAKGIIVDDTHIDGVDEVISYYLITLLHCNVTTLKKYKPI